jgi:hypothetical protein
MFELSKQFVYLQIFHNIGTTKQIFLFPERKKLDITKYKNYRIQNRSYKKSHACLPLNSFPSSSSFAATGE